MAIRRKYDCKRTQDFMHEVERMCCEMETCIECPIFNESKCGADPLKNHYDFNTVNAIVKKVQAWSDSNPVKEIITSFEKEFLEQFPTNYIVRRFFDNGLYLSSADDKNMLCIDSSLFNAVPIGASIRISTLLELEVSDE